MNLFGACIRAREQHSECAGRRSKSGAITGKPSDRSAPRGRRLTHMLCLLRNHEEISIEELSDHQKETRSARHLKAAQQ